MEAFIANHLNQSLSVKQAILNDPKILKLIKEICEECLETYKKGGKILAAGNGGSAADAQHLVAELVSRFYFDRPGLPAIALTTDTSILTAVGNDYGYEHVFSRQVEALGSEGDILIAISTSGNSTNVLKALTMAKTKKIKTIGLTGQNGGKMAALCDYCICVPSQDTPRIQEGHTLIAHTLCAVIEEWLFGKKH